MPQFSSHQLLWEGQKTLAAWTIEDWWKTQKVGTQRKNWDYKYDCQRKERLWKNAKKAVSTEERDC